jgi:hypothetical protein
VFVEGWMVVLASWLVACNEEPTSDLGTVTETPGGSYRVTYDDVGVACARSADTGVEVNVDFGDCLFCSDEIDLSCEILVERDVLVVHAGGSLLVSDDCGTQGTCEPTTAFCSLEGVAPGAYVLSYAEVDIPIGVPDGAWACTGVHGGIE